MKCLLVAKEKQADLQRASESSSPLWHLPPLSPVKLEVLLVLMWSWHLLHLLKRAQHKGCQKWDVNAIHLINAGIKEKSWNWSFFFFFLELKIYPVISERARPVRHLSKPRCVIADAEERKITTWIVTCFLPGSGVVTLDQTIWQLSVCVWEAAVRKESKSESRLFYLKDKNSQWSACVY